MSPKTCKSSELANVARVVFRQALFSEPHKGQGVQHAPSMMKVSIVV